MHVLPRQGKRPSVQRETQAVDPGVVEQAVLKLIAADPDGAWSTTQICRQLYPDLGRVEREHQTAIIRALRSMQLPGTWGALKILGELWLCDPCNLASMRAARRGGDPAHFAPGGMVYEQVERAKRFGDGSPLEWVQMRIEEEQKWAAQLMQAGGDRDALRAVGERIAELVKERDALMAGQ
jgi:hypothetical protein